MWPARAMSSAQVRFIESIEAIERAMSEPLLLNQSLTETVHNTRAALLRAGLMVRGFAGLESFLRSRGVELLARIPAANIPFMQLSKALRKACLTDALNALTFQSRFATSSQGDPEIYIQRIAAQIASTAHSAYQIPEVAFGHSRSNLSADDVRDLLGALLMKDPWGQLSRLAIRFQMTSPDLESDFKNIATLRNAAAHETNPNIEPSDLETMLRVCRTLAISFDFLMCAAVGRMIHGQVSIGSDKKEDIEASIHWSSLVPSTSGWREIKDGATRARKVWDTAEAGVVALTPRCGSCLVGLIQHHSQGHPTRWVPPFNL
jgi:hypothetical protein